ncbi:hypothetical protein LXL04_018197 [Taraxacum kok-saghyz]
MPPFRRASYVTSMYGYLEPFRRRTSNFAEMPLRNAPYVCEMVRKGISAISQSTLCEIEFLLCEIDFLLRNDFFLRNEFTIMPFRRAPSAKSSFLCEMDSYFGNVSYFRLFGGRLLWNLAISVKNSCNMYPFGTTCRNCDEFRSALTVHRDDSAPLKMQCELMQGCTRCLGIHSDSVLRTERVQKAMLQTLRCELEKLKIKDDETTNDFSGKISGIIEKFKRLGSCLEEEAIVRKFLNSVPKKYLPIVVSSEQYSDLESISLEEAVGSMKVGNMDAEEVREENSIEVKKDMEEAGDRSWKIVPPCNSSRSSYTVGIENRSLAVITLRSLEAPCTVFFADQKHGED